MRTLTILLIAFFQFLGLAAQDITGQWNGVLNVPGAQLRLFFNVAKTGNAFSATLDSPDQGAHGIPVTSMTFENPKIKFKIANLKIEYNGELKGNEIVGTSAQGGAKFPMNLTRKTTNGGSVWKPARPQEPGKPFPYHSEEVFFHNKEANITLSGTLTLPQREGAFPVVILISGSGPQNRDEEMFGHKPFLVIADHLTKNGIGVLRYDDRGVGRSGGNFAVATPADFATDAESAIAYLKTLKGIDAKKIGLAGHSEGGSIAPMVACKSGDVAFVVLLASPGIRGDRLLLMQQKLIGEASGVRDEILQKSEVAHREIFDIVIRSDDLARLKNDLTGHIRKVFKENPAVKKPVGMGEEDFIRAQVEAIATPWMQYFVRYDPATALGKARCPVLALNGGKDLQVPAKANLKAIKEALAKGGNTRVETAEFQNLNHLFQECTTGHPNEYAIIEQTFSPAALDVITKWIKGETDR
ncbi:MAG: lysophospholipase [Puniceicoccales bacterium]|jgi:pimeloyl-ACP methyl ester carboxylesterase|nr:lysophospholipase [Puniceicoccales bacterium]